jgi:hypothetical protein
MYNTEENDLDSSDSNPPSTGGQYALNFMYNVT